MTANWTPAAPAPTVCVARGRLDALGDDSTLAALLTPAEMVRFHTMPLARRRREYLASRVLAKCLFLDRFAMSHESSSADCRTPQLLDVDARLVAGFSPASYHDVEITRSLGADGPPRLRWRGIECPQVYLSISHASGWVAVGMSTHVPIGVDVAALGEHVPAFYRVQFSRREREWVALGGAATRVLHTLLWTLKESVVKTGAFPGATLWGYDEIEVLVDAPAGAVAATCAALHTGVLAPLGVHVTLAGGARVRNAWFSRVANGLLSLVTLEPSAA